MKTKGWRCVTALTLLALAVAPAAHADADQRAAAIEKLRAKFNAADADHDGLLSRDEAANGMPHVAAHFDEADTDHDGKLSQAEVAAYLVKLRGTRSK